MLVLRHTDAKNATISMDAVPWGLLMDVIHH